MKKYISLFLIITTTLSMLVGCGNDKPSDNSINNEINESLEKEEASSSKEEVVEKEEISGTKIHLSDTLVLVDGIEISTNEEDDLYIANDIVYYEDGKDFTYGEGTKKDSHSKEEAASHCVVHITKPGNYILSGVLNFGQIAIDLGEDAKEDPNAIVNLYLNNVSVTNDVAPSIIFYNVYEPFNDVTEETASKDVDTSRAGANVFIMDDTENSVRGSYVAKIYKEGTVILSEDGKTVEDAKKLHKYDGAFYSKMTLNINGGEKNTGILNIKAENEGLDSEMHLTINGGNINIESGNDGINTNEDGISVTTINGGNVNILVNGSTGEGDGIDSNGWLVINGGTLTSQACAFSGDAGIDSDMGIHINGGIVIASGNMLDRISESKQTFVVLNFDKFLGEGSYTFKNEDGNAGIIADIKNSFTTLIISSDELVEGDYTLWHNDTQLVGSLSENGNMFGGGMPNFDMENPSNGMIPPNMGGGVEMPKNPGGSRPSSNENNPSDFGNFDPNHKPNMDGKNPPEGFEMNEDGTTTLPDGSTIDPSKDKEHNGRPGGYNRPNMPTEEIELSEIFTITKGANYFNFVTIKE